VRDPRVLYLICATALRCTDANIIDSTECKAPSACQSRWSTTYYAVCVRRALEQSTTTHSYHESQRAEKRLAGIGSARRRVRIYVIGLRISRRPMHLKEAVSPQQMSSHSTVGRPQLALGFGPCLDPPFRLCTQRLFHTTNRGDLLRALHREIKLSREDKLGILPTTRNVILWTWWDLSQINNLCTRACAA